MKFRVANMELEHVPGSICLQRACFPPPFPEDLLWKREHLQHHLETFPAGQFVVMDKDRVIASASSTLISEENWIRHGSWEETVGGPFLTSFDAQGSTLYGIDISVHPDYRGLGVGRMLYGSRIELIRRLRLNRFGTACRMPGFREYSIANSGISVEQYAMEVVTGVIFDRTLTPLLRYGLAFIQVIHDYMEDKESGNAAALLEWTP